MNKEWVPTVDPETLYYTGWDGINPPNFEDHWPVGFCKMDVSKYVEK